MKRIQVMRGDRPATREEILAAVAGEPFPPEHEAVSVSASIPFQVPAGLKYDGIQEVGRALFLQFTEHDESSPSHGATFYVAAGQVIESDIAARRIEVRQKFSSAVGNGAQRDPATTPDDLVHETAAAGSSLKSSSSSSSSSSSKPSATKKIEDDDEEENEHENDPFAEAHGMFPPNDEIGGS